MEKETVMRKSLPGHTLVATLTLAVVGTTTALAVASAHDAERAGTRHTYVVGGEVVHPPAPASRPAAATSARSNGDSTRYGYVVGGELVPAR
jgi:hypothetical protein